MKLAPNIILLEEIGPICSATHKHHPNIPKLKNNLFLISLTLNYVIVKVDLKNHKL